MANKTRDIPRGGPVWRELLVEIHAGDQSVSRKFQNSSMSSLLYWFLQKLIPWQTNCTLSSVYLCRNRFDLPIRSTDTVKSPISPYFIGYPDIAHIPSCLSHSLSKNALSIVTTRVLLRLAFLRCDNFLARQPFNVLKYSARFAWTCSILLSCHFFFWLTHLIGILSSPLSQSASRATLRCILYCS